MTIGCLTISFERKGGLEVGARRIGGLSVSMGLVCEVSYDSDGIIWASDGKLITLEGGYLIGA